MTTDAGTFSRSWPPPGLNSLWGALVIEELVRNGIDTFCLSPGSRCTPLTLAVASHPHVRSIMHFDERGAAYYALGCAKCSGQPVALICTSGTAVANYLPAVVEASMSCMPLILLTADRPPELLEAGANQAVVQPCIFGDYVRWQFTLPCPDRQIEPEAVLTAIDQAVYRARRAPAGPVHINCMFREPLVPSKSGEDLQAHTAQIAGWKSGLSPYTRYSAPHAPAPDNELHKLLETASRGLLVVGGLSTAEEASAARELARALCWPVFPDVASGLRLDPGEPHTIHYYDLALLSPQFQDRCAPDVVLQVGAPVTSKRLLEYLKARPPHAYAVAANHPFRLDPHHRVTLRVEADLAPFCQTLAASVRGGSPLSWLEYLQAASQNVHQSITEHMAADDSLGEPAVARLISSHIPERSTLFLGNSMPIRDMDMFASPHGRSVRIAANRGASGIDGTVATTAGFASASGGPVTVLLGDLALLHDLNSLALLRNTEAPVVVVVVNNNGGGIFSFLPVADFPEHFERFFGAPHGLQFRRAAEMFGLDYYHAESKSAFTAAYTQASQERASSIIEVTTDRTENLRIHRALQQAVVMAIEEGAGK